MSSDAVRHLKSLKSIRQRCGLLLTHPEFLQNFNVNLGAVDTVVDYIISQIARDYRSPSDIPMHSRWRHFQVSPPSLPMMDRVRILMDEWKSLGMEETVKRLLDLFVISVLLDAGAGDRWSFLPEERWQHPGNRTHRYTRSEALALASLELYCSGAASSTGFGCDAQGLQNLDFDTFQRLLQVDDGNPMVGVQGRFNLLKSLGKVLESQPYFQGKVCRPGNLLDWLLSNGTKLDEKIIVPMEVLWEVVIVGFNDVWPPGRTKFEGEALGDVWPCIAMKKIVESSIKKPDFIYPGTESFVCFHKLSQWLTYSLMEPLKLLNIEFRNSEAMTGLAEYRNGGLFMDCGVLQLKSNSQTETREIPSFNVFDDVVVEWRALTVALLDMVGEKVRSRLGMSIEDLPLVKVLEAGKISFKPGTWKAGREMAAKLRPETKGPPINVISDGTVF
jgi:hypothetical protein